MTRKTKKLLEDVRMAAEHVLQFASGKSLDDYRSDVMLRSAVERQFEIIGEALARLERLDPSTAAQIKDVREIIAFRNVLAHGYDIIDDGIVWGNIQIEVPDLLQTVVRLLQLPDTPSS
ncbi:MAG: DUF86 domain-containing protein [Planctomycetales bacterium]|nr:DUF86 domain-containing protein [Planctomycetales bacterium]